ncbi:hypothetical protein BH10PSE19_BH10PSE19_03060 [soil metagenome]
MSWSPAKKSSKAEEAKALSGRVSGVETALAVGKAWLSSSPSAVSDTIDAVGAFRRQMRFTPPNYGSTDNPIPEDKSTVVISRKG